MTAQERIDNIVNAIIAENTSSHTRTSTNMIKTCRRQSQQYRIAAAMAAQSGLQSQAIELTNSAQRCDKVLLHWIEHNEDTTE